LSDRILVLLSVRSPKPAKPYISSSFLKTRAIAEYLELVFERSHFSLAVSAIAFLDLIEGMRSPYSFAVSAIAFLGLIEGMRSRFSFGVSAIA
jgi:hypothetical protein